MFSRRYKGIFTSEREIRNNINLVKKHVTNDMHKSRTFMALHSSHLCLNDFPPYSYASVFKEKQLYDRIAVIS